jgi:sulfide:quinone oxidoreductase
MPFKCPGAPQKVAYLTADHLRRKGLLEGCNLHFLTHGPSIFGVPYFAKKLVKVAERYDIDVHYQHNLTSIDGAAKQASFEVVGGEGSAEKITMDFDMIHVTPPQGPSDLIRSGGLANEAGWVDVHDNTLQHTKYPNIFALGDAASTPNSKTAAAIRKQAPVVIRNLLQMMEGGDPEPNYDGYASCPLVTAYGKVILAEFIYGGKVTPTLPLLDPGKERLIGWWTKKTGLPIMYWNYMLKGHEWFLSHNKSWEDPES